MADTVDSKVLINNGIHYHVRLTNESDGTGESNVVKIDFSALTAFNNEVIKAIDVYRIYGMVGGMNYVTLEWDATTNDEIIVLPRGSFDMDWTDSGGLRDPISSAATGDVLLSTDGAVDGDSYSITLECRIRNR